MSKQKDRENFLLTMAKEGVPADVARLVMRHATTLQRLAELQCSSEAYDRDRVKCPAHFAPALPKDAIASVVRFPCLCGDYGSKQPDGRHGMIPRGAVTEYRRERQIERLLFPYNVTPVFQGDPRGAVVKLKVPSGRTDDWGQTGVCVP